MVPNCDADYSAEKCCTDRNGNGHCTRASEQTNGANTYCHPHQGAEKEIGSGRPRFGFETIHFEPPNGRRVSGERRGEADERVRCTRVLGSTRIASEDSSLRLLAMLWLRPLPLNPPRKTWWPHAPHAQPAGPFARACLTGGASAASEEAKPTNESAARAC